MTNMTYAQALETAIELVGEFSMNDENGNVVREFPEVVEKLTALKEQLAKRSSAKTPTKTQKENEIIMERIVDALADAGKPITVTELLAHGIEGYELTNQKASALLRKLKDTGRVTKTIEGKKAMFSIA